MRGQYVLRLLLAAALPAAAHAQTIYRCGNTYSQTPCAGAQALAPEPSADAARDKERKAQADAATRRDLKTAETLEKNRLKNEAALARSQRAGQPAYGGGGDDYDEARAEQKKKYFTAHAGPPSKHRRKGRPHPPAAAAPEAPARRP